MNSSNRSIASGCDSGVSEDLSSTSSGNQSSSSSSISNSPTCSPKKESISLLIKSQVSGRSSRQPAASVDYGDADDSAGSRQSTSSAQSGGSQNCGLSMLANVSTHLLENGEEDDSFGSQSHIRRCYFTRDPARHRLLEKERRDRVRKVLDGLVDKIPEHLLKTKCPNKTKPSQIDTLELAIYYIDYLENLAFQNESTSREPDRAKERRIYESGYRQCAEDLQHFAKREQVLCGDSRRLIHYLQTKQLFIPFPREHEYYNTPSKSYSQSYSHSSSEKRSLEDSASDSGYATAVYKRLKDTTSQRFTESSSNRNAFEDSFRSRSSSSSNTSDGTHRSEAVSILAPLNAGRSQDSLSILAPLARHAGES